MQKLGTVLFCLTLIGAGGAMAVAPWAFDFGSGAHGVLKGLFKTISESIGVRPLGGILVGVGSLWMLLTMGARKAEA
jgi:hypothetical protein